jgi:hypothetical protein
MSLRHLDARPGARGKRAALNAGALVFVSDLSMRPLSPALASFSIAG